MRQTYTIESVKNIFRKNGCELLEKEYQNNRTSMSYRCHCGDISKVTLYNFQVSPRCRKCAGNEKYSYDYVKKYFKDHGCDLLEKIYTNNKTSMKFICSCGNADTIKFKKFLIGHRCHKCAVEKIKGENNGNYNSLLTDEERIIKRNYEEYRQWRKAIYKNNNYTCQKCYQKGGRLNAHHVENYSDNKDLRLIRSNGITFCKKHHKEFHCLYGIKNTNRKQLEEFLK